MIDKIESCDLCGKEVSSNGRVIAKGLFDHYGVKTIIHIIMCKYCKYIFQHERFDHNTLSFLYEQDGVASSLSNISKSGIYQENLKKRQKFISEAISLASLPGEKILNILDVGGGGGEVTEHLLSRDKVYLADISTKDPIHPDIIKVNKLFDKVDFLEKFDVIVMNHVLEHVFSPMASLMRANSLLTDQGIVVIEVPFELYTPLSGRTGDWKHVAYFSTDVLRNFLRKAKFDPIYVKLSTGYYETRKLAVIRAVARKKTGTTTSIDCGSGYLQLLLDSFNPGALTLYLSSQIRKLLP